MLLLVHLIKSLFRAFFKILFTALIAGSLAAEATLLLVRLYGPTWPPPRLIEIVVGAIGLLVAYAAGLTALFLEALHAALTVERGVVKGIDEEVAGPGGRHKMAGARH